MTAWTYGEAGEKYPVQFGDLWAVGDHWFMCSDLMDSRIFDETALELRTPTLLYCDPPWGQALVNGFRTKAGLGKATYRWEELYARIAQIGHSRGIPVWMEGSKSESRDGQKIPGVIAHPRERGYPGYFGTTYFKTHPSGLYYAGTVPHPASLDGILEGVDDEETPGVVMSAYEPGTVVDPCAGMGLTSRHAWKHGWGSVNNELSPFRMSAALDNLVMMTGLEAVRI